MACGEPPNSTALAILRKLEEEGLRRRSSEIAITVSPLVALYLLNQKRRSLQMIEDRYGVAVCVLEDADLVPPDHRLERLKPYDARVVEEAAEVEETPAEAETSAGEEPAAMEREEAGAGRGRRRRPRRRRRDDDVSLPPEEQVEMRQPEEADEEAEADAAIDADDAAADQAIEVTAEEGGDQPNRRRRRRGKRGGRRRARPGIALEVAAGDLDADEALEPIYADEVSQEEGYDGNSLDAAAASAVMDDDGGPIWSARTINDAEPSSPTAEVAFIDEAEAVPDVSDEELNEGVDNAEPGEAAPRTRRRSPRRSRSKRVLEAETADAAEPSASTDVAEPEDALIVAPIPMAIAEDVKEEALAAAAEQSSAEDEVRAPSPWSVSGDIATASAPHQAESSPAEVSVARGEFSRDEPGESLADAERNRAHREEEERRAEEARRTEVIQVGEGSNERDDNPRRGWWQRLLT